MTPAECCEHAAVRSKASCGEIADELKGIVKTVIAPMIASPPRDMVGLLDVLIDLRKRMERWSAALNSISIEPAHQTFHVQRHIAEEVERQVTARVAWAESAASQYLRAYCEIEAAAHLQGIRLDPSDLRLSA